MIKERHEAAGEEEYIRNSRQYIEMVNSTLADLLNRMSYMDNYQIEAEYGRPYTDYLNVAIEFFKSGVYLNGKAEDYCRLGRAYFDLARESLNDDSVSNLENAINSFGNAINLCKAPEYYHYLGRSQYLLAESTSDHDKKMVLFKKGIANLTRATHIDPMPRDYFFLGEAYRSMADDTFDFEERRNLAILSLKNYKKSYKMDNNEETLKLISEVMADFGVSTKDF